MTQKKITFEPILNQIGRDDHRGHCGTCRYWFNYNSPKPKFAGSREAVCNHPLVGGKGLAPIKSFDTGCKKYEKRKQLESPDPRDW